MRDVLSRESQGREQQISSSPLLCWKAGSRSCGRAPGLLARLWPTEECAAVDGSLLSPRSALASPLAPSLGKNALFCLSLYCWAVTVVCWLRFLNRSGHLR